MTQRTRARSWFALVVAGGLAASALAVVPGLAATADEPRTFALVGSLQDELGCAADWAPDCAETELVATATPGVYAADFVVPAGTYEYKVAVDDAWDESYGLNGGGDNIPLTVAGDTPVRVVFDDTLKRVGLEATGLRGAYTDDDDAALVADPVRQPGSDENFYFVMTDRFANGDTTNDEGGLTGDALTTGFDPTHKGFYQGGDLQGLRDRLDYIEGLGTSAIWLTPSFKNRPVQGEGADASSGYHGYWVTDFTQIDPHLGTNAELEALIGEAHAKGIKVYFDIITNHTADVIDYEQQQYSYIDQATSPYTDADGNVIDLADYADGSTPFPTLDAATSFPYTPVVRPEDADLKVPAWLNDPTLYHNRGDSTWEGESVTYGDFVGLDDLMTEHPTVVNGFVDVYDQWIDLGIDGFRIDTAKHVNFEFWEQWSTQVLDYAHEHGKPDFFMFGEVYDADPQKLSPYVRKTDMNSVLDFTFQSQAVSFAAGNSAKNLQSLFAGDDYYTTPDSSASALPTFLGNHDMGRVGYFLQNTDAPLERDELAHDLLFLTRGQPVVYSGDEQGFAGIGGDQSARQTLFASQVDEYVDQELVTGETAGSVDRYDTDAPLYEHIAALSALRQAHPALATGAQIERYVDNGAGVYAFSRVDRDEKVEYLVAANNANEERTVQVPTLTKDGAFTVLSGDGQAVTADADGVASVTVPALGAVVWKADRAVSAPDAASAITVATPAAGAGISGITPVVADVDDATWQETSFAWRVAGATGDDAWHALGTAEDTSPRVFHDTAGLAGGTLIEYRAVSTDAAGNRAAASTYASIGNAVNLVEVEEPEQPIDLVTVAGSHNSEMGCAGDWAPGCEAAKLTLRADGIYEGTFTIPAGDYEYKVAINGSWDVNYGANGELNGGNITYSTDGSTPVTFFWNPNTHVVSSTAEGPVVTLPGSLQSELGCPGDWQPECLATLMQDGDKDGVYTYSTSALPAGSYEVKVAHGRSWDENYGVGGAPGGDNYTFTTADGKLVEFRYTLETHVLEIVVSDPPLAGTGQSRAHWVSEDTLAWPAELLGAASAADAEFTLQHSPDAGLAVADGAVAGGGDAIELEVDPAGLSEEQLATFPALEGFVALHPVGLERADIEQLLTEQLAVAQTTGGELSAFTGVQLPGVLDHVYGGAVATTTLGLEWDGSTATARLWAPTARSVSLERWDAGATGDPELVAAERDDEDGTWSVEGLASGDEYRWSVEVFAPSTGAIETNSVTDPYSVALTTNSARTVVVDLDDPAYQPALWRDTAAPVVERAVDRSIYELHVRDFSIGDETVPEAERGTYKAFTRDSAGTAQLRELAAAGINTVHLLPTFDLATIEEERAEQATPDCDLASYGPASPEQQACVSAIRDLDGFNWGYDPFHFQAPEGSYAVDPDGGARVSEFREMVGALHGTGLQVVLDEVYNHTAEAGQGQKSVLDRIVPGYYQRLNAYGAVETSTCCQNVATEHEVAQKLMVDSVVLWAKQYKVDGFRFDLMGHHSKANLLAVRAALDELTLAADGVDGSSVYLYGEGWNFGEVADNALFEQATQGQLGGTGIGTFNDRLRDAVHGGSPVDGTSTYQQGFGTGLGTAPNGQPGTPAQADQLVDLGHQTDLVKLGLAGNLRGYELTDASGETVRGDELDYRGAPAGYADQPDEVINYVDAHDNETLYDVSVLKLPTDTSMADRVRMNTLSLATVTLSQSPSFWHAGTELLRSKSLDRNSYNSGDWFNRIDWTGQESTFGSGLPMQADNGDKWPIMEPLLADPALKPTADDIAAAEASALDLLRVRSSVDLLQLGSAELIEQKLSFPNSGADATPGLITMLVDDLVGDDVDPELDGALVVFNASPEPIAEAVDGLAGREFALTQAQASGSDAVVKATAWDAATGTVTVPARSVAVLVEVQETTGEPGGPGEPGEPGGPGEPGEPGAATPTVQLSVGSVRPGDVIGVTGTGFEPGETVQIWLHSTPVLLVAATADADGALSTNATIPLDAEPGDHEVRLLGVGSGLEASAALVVLGPLGMTGTEIGFVALLALVLLAGGALVLAPRIRRMLRGEALPVE
ncbi:pullulanase-type alpha-1,6-glucosidase [Agromyces terreus]|uniref:Pullulanase-type alpha-1,6-glucosidase n=1 Tax=Agromyces terreus TaxID=424795 RepID=A0A9X2GZL4_9MICO|nr:pullulanase-type alpha-1,6-glucosidase [Agromyces terreus]MCP2370025.1 pullulanase-type alpha-1,6-glucosidase [Agromyces terreus]